MAIAINFSQAVKLFINHLNKGNVEEKWIKIYKQSLQGPFKRLIAGELKVYPLNLAKVKDKSLKHRIHSFSYAINTFHSFIHDDPHLSNTCFGEALAKMEKRLIGLSPVTLKMIKQSVLQIVTIDIDELEVSHIPEKVIHDCIELWGMCVANLVSLFNPEMIILGGGVPKNYIQQVEPMLWVNGFNQKTGHKYAVQITTDDPKWGGLSGCTFSEAKTWGKVEKEADRKEKCFCGQAGSEPEQKYRCS